MLGGIQRLDRIGQLRGLSGGNGNGLVTALVAQQRRDGFDHLGGRVQQWLCIEDFKPAALTVLGADAKGEAKNRIVHK
jgi:hypothetical protein